MVISQQFLAHHGATVRLFKYLHPDRVDVLRDKLLCFSVPPNLNDPFELNPPLKLFDSTESLLAAVEDQFGISIQERLDLMPPSLRAFMTPDVQARIRAMARQMLPAVIDSGAPALQQRVNDALAKAIGILCLSERQDDLLMWAHYTNAHEGFVIEFDPSSDFFNGRLSDKDEFRHLRQVKYAEVRPQIVMNQVKDMSAYLTKSSHWSYEREWRMMLALADATEVKVFGEKQFHLFSYPANAIRSVTLGCRMSAIKREEILGVLSLDPDLSTVPIYQASPDDSLFQLNITRLVK
jgi:hypothetical protein